LLISVSVPVKRVSIPVKRVAKSLSRSSSQLINKVHTLDVLLQKAYRIELAFENKKWILRACIDPIRWYDSIINNTKSMDYALRFIANCRKYGQETLQPKLETPKTAPCTNNHCKRSTCRFLHEVWPPCTAMINYLDGGSSTQCGFTIYEENKIDQVYGLDNWSLFVRPFELTREVLLIPSPSDIKFYNIPHGNKGLIQQPSFWKAAQEISIKMSKKTLLQTNPVTRIVVNFGEWETGMRLNPLLEECHAHAHLWLTTEFTRCGVYPKLAKHDYPPEDYLIANARELERERLFATRLTGIETRLTGIETDISKILNLLQK